METLLFDRPYFRRRAQRVARSQLGRVFENFEAIFLRVGSKVGTDLCWRQTLGTADRRKLSCDSARCFVRGTQYLEVGVRSASRRTSMEVYVWTPALGGWRFS